MSLATHDPAVLPPRTITADRLVLAAGALGSTFLLLKNRAAFPTLSPRLGARFCDNGDLLGFALKCSEDADGQRVPRVVDPAHGPVITSSIRVPDVLDGDGSGRGYYIQDAGYPEFVSWMLQVFDTPGALQQWWHAAVDVVEQWLHRRGDTNLAADMAGLFGSCELSAGLLPLLGMGRDVPSGQMSLRDDGMLDVAWSAERSQDYFDRVRGTMRDLASALGATYMDDPLWLVSRVITVHALGGCPMGRDAGEGVVDACGEVFNYPGLYVADGAVMPGPVGANPSLTIAALADRFADALIARVGPTQVAVAG
jgi:cholesterol oxidase